MPTRTSRAFGLPVPGQWEAPGYISGGAQSRGEGLTALAADGAGGPQVCPSGPGTEQRQSLFPQVQMDKMAQGSLKTAPVGWQVETVAMLGRGDADLESGPRRAADTGRVLFLEDAGHTGVFCL